MTAREKQVLEKKAAVLCVAMHAWLSRGNTQIHTDDPVTMALYLGCSQLLKEWAESARPNNGLEG